MSARPCMHPPARTDIVAAQVDGVTARRTTGTVSMRTCPAPPIDRDDEATVDQLLRSAPPLGERPMRMPLDDLGVWTGTDEEYESACAWAKRLLDGTDASHLTAILVTLGTRTHRIEVYRTHVSAAPPALAELRMLPWHEAKQRIEDMGATWRQE